MAYYSPSEIAIEFVNTGIRKTKTPFSRFALLALLGGAFIAFGGLLSMAVAGGMPGVMGSNPGLLKFIFSSLFPVGLIMVSVAGADLFTSDCAYMTMPCLERRISITALCKVLFLSYIFNFIGTQIVAYFFSYQTGIFSSDMYQSYLQHYASAKINQDWYKVLVKGIGANWLVCLGTWMGYAAKDISGKAIGTWIPVMLFVTLGFEHSIANMYFIPTAIYYGADISWVDFIVNNLIPATIGNIIGGGLLVGCAYWFVYLKDNRQ